MIRVPYIVSWPGRVPAARRSGALQSLVDLAPSFLDCCGIDVPRRMTGLSQKAVWCGETDAVRSWAVVENRHQPHKLNARTYVDARYKLTLYEQGEEGELFDLEADPGEVHNLWSSPDHAGLKGRLLLRYAQAELEKEVLPMPRISGA